MLIRVLGFAFLLLVTACGADDRPGVATGGAGGSPTPALECDRDSDGSVAARCGGDDCNDDDAAISPQAQEICGNAVDDDCDGLVDEDCDCTPGDVRSCFPGADAERHVGVCTDGQQICGSDGAWGACADAVTTHPEEDECNGVDEDCDGVADAALLGACGTCGAPAAEVCGNGLDDDCDGMIDDPSVCRLSCAGIDAAAPAPTWLACCGQDPATGERSRGPVRHSFGCVEWEGLPGCTTDERRCHALGEDTACVKSCTGTACVCGVEEGGEVVPHAGCGFETPCAFLGCEGRSDQPCYSGPPHTLGVGICRGGRTSCESAGWGACEGEVLPGLEICGNGLDDDCDGQIDVADGATGKRCVVGALCAPGAEERCGNGLDDDCDGGVDELCVANGTEQACYRGPASTRTVGACRDGVQHAAGLVWGPCIGDVLPGAEICGDGVDSDCNGLGGEGQLEDPGCVTAPPVPETCNGVDDDGNGLVDDGVVNACGRCGDDPPCSVSRFDSPAACDAAEGRSCQQLAPLDGDPSIVTIDTDKRVGLPEFAMYTYGLGVDKYDIETGELVWSVPLTGRANIQPPGARLQVMPDNSVWAGTDTRWAPATYTYHEELSLLYHVDRNGNVLCEVDIVGGVQGIAADPAGFIWVAAGFEGIRTPEPPAFGYVARRHLHKFHPSRVHLFQPDGTPWPNGVPQCWEIDLAPGDPLETGLELPVAPMVIRIDSRGTLWGSGPAETGGANPHLLRLDTRTLAFEYIESRVDRAQTLAADDWLYSFSRVSPELVATPPEPPYATRDEGLLHEVVVQVPAAIKRECPVLLAGGKYLMLRGWAPNSDLAIHTIDARTGVVGEIDIPPELEAQNPYPFLEEDPLGRLWISGACGHLTYVPALGRYDPQTGGWLQICVPDYRPTISSDVFGTAYRRRLASTGRWSQIVDSIYPGTIWQRLDWQEYVPTGTAVEAYVAFADNEAEFDGAPITCGPFSSPPIDLNGCEGQGRRFARVELVLRSGATMARPYVRNIELGWSRP